MICFELCTQEFCKMRKHKSSKTSEKELRAQKLYKLCETHNIREK
jgi:hypothetical protein